MNPQAILQFMSALNTFKSNHPKIAGFIEHFIKNGIPVDSVIEITITKPGEAPMTTNMKVSQSDLDLISTLKGMRG